MTNETKIRVNSCRHRRSIFRSCLNSRSDSTEYRRLTKEHVAVKSCDGHEMLCVEPAALTLLAAQAFHDINFFLRPAHLKQVAAILDDPRRRTTIAWSR